MEWIIALLIAAVAFLLWETRAGGRYPDGRCCLCRKGIVLPGETCRQCGTYQPEPKQPSE